MLRLAESQPSTACRSESFFSTSFRSGNIAEAAWPKPVGLNIFCQASNISCGVIIFATCASSGFLLCVLGDEVPDLRIDGLAVLAAAEDAVVADLRCLVVLLAGSG